MVEARPGEPGHPGAPLGRYGSTISGRYRLDEPQPTDLPGAERWSATDQILARSVTVTLLSGPRTAVALDSARRAALVVDPRLTRILDVGADDGTGYVVTESPEGRSLAALAARAPLTTDQARAVVGEAAAALEVARRRGVHHLALRPSVLRVTPAGRVVIDGLAVDGELLDAAGAGAHATSRSDTIGLVRVLYAALTGRWPVARAADGRPTVPTFDEWAASTDHGHRPAGDDTGHPAVDHGLPTAPEHDGAPLPPADLVPSVPADLDTLCVVTLGPHDDGPHSPGELVRELEPWGAVRADEIFRAADAGRWPALPDTFGTAAPSGQTPPRTTGNPAGTTTAPSTGSSPMNDDLHGTTPAPDGAVTPIKGTPASTAGRGAAAVAAGGALAAGAVTAGADAAAAADAGVKGTTGTGAGAVGAGAAGVGAAGAVTDGAGAAGNVARQSVRSAFSGAETAGTRRPGTPPPATPAPASFPPAAQPSAPTRTSVRPSSPTAPTGGPAATSTGSTGTAPAGSTTSGTGPAPTRADSAAASPTTGATQAATPPMTTPRSAPASVGPARTTAIGATAGAGATAASAGAAAPAAATSAIPTPTAVSPAASSPTPGSPTPGPTSPAAFTPGGTGSGPATTSIFDPTSAAARGTGGGAGAGPSRPDWDPPFPTERPAPPLAQRRFDPTRWVLGFVALAVVIGVVIALNNVLSPWQSSDDTANDAPVASPSAIASAPAAAAAPADEGAAQDAAAGTVPPVIASVSSIDLSDGDGEHEELVGRVIDGDPATSWYTHTYNRPDYAGFKDAIGLAVTLQAPATVTSITLTVNGTGGNVEVRSTDAANPTVGDVLVSGPLAPTTVLTLSQPTETQSIVLWFTELAQTADGANRIEISELSVS